MIGVGLLIFIGTAKTQKPIEIVHLSCAYMTKSKQLVFGYQVEPSQGWPRERLYMEENGVYRILLNTRDLIGAVQIRDKMEALAFIRLDSSPAFINVWDSYSGGSREVEVLPFSYLSSETYYAFDVRVRLHKSVVSSMKNIGWRGLIPDELYYAQVKPPKISLHNREFVITRTLVRRIVDDRKGRYSYALFEVCHRIRSNGSCSEISRKRLHPLEIRWNF